MAHRWTGHQRRRNKTKMYVTQHGSRLHHHGGAAEPAQYHTTKKHLVQLIGERKGVRTCPGSEEESLLCHRERWSESHVFWRFGPSAQTE